MSAAAGAVRHLRFRDLPGGIGALVLAAFTASCSSPTNPGPVVDLAVQSVNPNSGPASGGTQISIRGSGFATGSTVTVGGPAATEISVSGSDVINARTPVSPIAGAVDIAVTASGLYEHASRRFQVRAISSEHRARHSIDHRARQPSETARLVCRLWRDHSGIARRRGRGVACDAARISVACVRRIIHGNRAASHLDGAVGGTLPSVCTIDVIVSDGPHVLTTSLSVRVHNSAVEVGGSHSSFSTTLPTTRFLPRRRSATFMTGARKGERAQRRDPHSEYTHDQFEELWRRKSHCCVRRLLQHESR